MKIWMASAFATSVAAVALSSCSSAPAPQTESKAMPESVSSSSANTTENAQAADLPVSYKNIQFPEFNYVAPYPKDFRVEVAPGITGYIVSDRSLPLVNFTVYFDESKVPASLSDEAAISMVGSMLRRGGGGGLNPHALDDSLEFISAGLSTSAGTFSSMFDIDCLSKDFVNMMATAKQVLTAPGFDKEQLELIKANFVTSYDRRYDTPAKVLSALKAKVNYAPNARMWDANAEEYKSVTVDDVKRLAEGVFSSKKIVFALSGDVDKDSALVMLKEFFANWKVEPPKTVVKPEPLAFLNKPGIYVVDKDITQAIFP